MKRRVVCDSSALVALLLDSGADGEWVTEAIADAELVAPSLAAYEAANIIRRHELAGVVGTTDAAQAHADLLDLAIEQWPYGLIAMRAWELRRNLSCYDASYVALAESLEATLVTLDQRIGRAPGVQCVVASPP